jgi:hypothetical protein
MLSIVSFHNGESGQPEMSDDETRERMSGNSAVAEHI